MNDYSKFVPNVHFEQIPIRNLVSVSYTHLEAPFASFIT